MHIFTILFGSAVCSMFVLKFLGTVIAGNMIPSLLSDSATSSSILVLWSVNSSGGGMRIFFFELFVPCFNFRCRLRISLSIDKKLSLSRILLRRGFRLAARVRRSQNWSRSSDGRECSEDDVDERDKFVSFSLGLIIDGELLSMLTPSKSATLNPPPRPRRPPLPPPPLPLLLRFDLRLPRSGDLERIELALVKNIFLLFTGLGLMMNL